VRAKEICIYSRRRLVSWNNLLTLTQSTRLMPGARINFSTAKSSEKLDSLWTKTGLVGMLQAKDMRSVTTVLPFVAALVDRMCGEEAVAPTTRVFVAYTNLCHKKTGCYVEGDSGSTLDGFTMAFLDKLANDIASFKSQAVNIYGKYQRPGMGTNKFHLLDHVVEDVMRLGSLLLLSADSFESSHKSVKEAFTATSQRNATWMPESFAVMGRHKMSGSALSRMAGCDSGPSQRNLSNIEQDAGVPEVNCALSGAKQYALMHDTSVPAAKSVTVRLDDLRWESIGIPTFGTAVFDAGSLTSRSATADASSATQAAVLAKELGMLACGTLLEELDRIFGSADEYPDHASCVENMETLDGLPVLSGKQVERVNSAHAASFGVPIASSLTSGDDGYISQIRRNQHRTLQNIVASGSYYNTRR
jgi:hypothetical protein